MAGPSVATIKQLFAVSGNVCAFPRCTEPLVTGGVLVGDMCHIKAASAGGPRYDPAQSAAERHGFGNLILLCKKHHAIIDGDVAKYTTVDLSEIKASHEAKQDGRFAISDSLAIRLAIFSAGVAASSAIGEVARAVQGIAESLSYLFPGKPKRGEIGVSQFLKEVGPGRIAYCSDVRRGEVIGDQILNLFKGGGWQVAVIPVGYRDFYPKSEWPRPALMILVEHRNHEIALGVVAVVVDAAISNLGFRRIDQRNWENIDGERSLYVVLSLL